MIEGLKLDFTTNELDSHLCFRVQHHRERVAFYAKQVEALKAGNAEAQQYTNGDPIQSLATSLKQHQNRAELLEVMRAHLVPKEIYRLDENDLIKLELLSGRMW